MRAHEFTDHRVMAKIERTGQIVQILRHADHVKFSDEPGWFLINTEPGRRTGTGIKWIPDSTRFTWVKNFQSLKERKTQNFQGIDMVFKDFGDDIIQIRAQANGRELGYVTFVQEGDTLLPQDLEVDERYRGQGIAAAMYDYAKSLGYKIRRSGQQTAAGAGFWQKHRPNQNVWEQDIAEAFDRPYKADWEKSEHGDYDALATLPDGTYLSIMFNHEGDDEWQVEFHRGHSQGITGQGDQQRIFATVLAAIQKFIKQQKPWRLIFSANKDVAPGQNSESRARLYNSLVKRYAAIWGYEPYAEDHGDQITYELTRSKQAVTEAKLPRAIEEFLDSLNPDDCGVEDIGAYRIHFEGFTSDCKSSADYRRNPEAVYQQVYQDFIQREGGQKPVVQDMVGDERFPILYSIFRRKRAVSESQQATARQVLNYINKTHHEPFKPGEKMYAAVMAHPRWELKRVPLLNLNIPDQEYDDVDYDEYEPEADPYGRVMMVEPGHAGEVSQHLIDKKPIVIDADRYIIDGNHRAWAAKYLLNRDYIDAWVPVEQIAEITRRDFLRGAGAMAGTAALGSPSAQSETDTTKILNSGAILWAICRKHYPNNPNTRELQVTVKRLTKSQTANSVAFNEEYRAMKERLADWETRDPAGYAKFVNKYMMNFAKIKADLETLPELMI